MAEVESSREMLPQPPSGGLGGKDEEMNDKPVPMAESKKTIVSEAESATNKSDVTPHAVEGDESTDEKLVEENSTDRDSSSVSNGKKSDSNQSQEVRADDEEVKSQGGDPEAIVVIGADESDDGDRPADERRSSRCQSANQEKSDDTTQEEMEENQSSNSSSPSALHIHLDEEKDETQPTGTVTHTLYIDGKSINYLDVHSFQGKLRTWSTRQTRIRHYR